MKFIVAFLIVIVPLIVIGQNRKPIYDEADVPDYILPELLKTESGKKIKNVKKWEKKRRPEILRMFTEEMFGKVPGDLEISEIRLVDESDNALDGLARRKQVVLAFNNNDKEVLVELLVYMPKDSSSFPTILACNFMGNHTICDDPNIRLTESWVKDNPALGIVNNQITEQSRGVRSSRWPVKKIIESGCALATIYYGDIDPDWDNFNNGVHPLLYKEGQERPEDDEWGAIAAWSWGLSRVMDYFETDDEIDAAKVVVMGHSRLGKTALWAGATDQRFAGVISNDSGCGGAALSRRKFGETIDVINQKFPHWFNDRFLYYNNREYKLPFDQHMLLALIAPRPLYIASASEDLWADPRGEFLSAKYAGAVYNLYDLQGLETDEMPDVDHPIGNTIKYHIRTGKHDVTDFDWEQYIQFAKELMK